MPRAPSPLRYGVLFAVAAALFALHPLCFQTYLRLFYPEGGQLVQPDWPEGLPVPRTMVWPDGLVDLVGAYARLTSAAVLGIEIALACVFVYGVLRALNPTFRLTTGIDWDRRLLLRTYMHTAPLIKAFLIAMAAVVPTFAFWHLAGAVLGHGAGSLWLRAAVLGGAFWALFSRDGVAGDYDSGNYEWPRQRTALGSLLARGALGGTVLYAVAGLVPYVQPDRYFEYYRALGAIGPPQWWRIAGISLGLAAGLGLAGGILTVAFGAPGLPARRRALQGASGVLVLGICLLAGAVVLPRTMTGRDDLVNGGTGPEAAARLSALSGVRLAAGGVETVLVLGDGGLPALQVRAQSVAGLDASPAGAAQVEAYLRRHGYRTALAQPAFQTLYDAACLQWSPAGCLRVCLLNLARCPDVIYLTQLVERLQTGGASADARAAADALANGAAFAYPDREARVLMGDLYARLGVASRAETWYRLADLPPGQVGARVAERSSNADGRVTGRITLDGSAVPGLRVGVVPAGAVNDPGMLVDPGLLRPYWLRWVASASRTDREGRFTLDHLPSGAYRLVAGGPPARLPSTARPVPGPASVPMVIDPSRRVAALGTVALASGRP